MFSYKRYDWDWVNPNAPRPKPTSRLLLGLVNKLK